MKKRIENIAVHKTALTLATIFGLLYAPFVLIIAVVALFTKGIVAAIMMLIFAALYFGLCYVMFAPMLWLYNICVKKFNMGIEFTTAPVEEKE